MGYDTPPPGYGQQFIRQLQAGLCPVADIISRHRAEVAQIWERHAAELSRPVERSA